MTRRLSTSMLTGRNLTWLISAAASLAACGDDDPRNAKGGVEHALHGHWRLEEVWITPSTADAPMVGHGATRCAAANLDQAFGGLTIETDGAFAGWPVTDYEDVWTGSVVGDDAGWTFDLEGCTVDCRGYDVDPARLGQIGLADGHLRVEREGTAHLDIDGQDCALCLTCGEDAGHVRVEGAALEFVYGRVTSRPVYTHAEVP